MKKKYFDWLTDETKHPTIILFNVWVKQSSVSSELSFVGTWLKNPTIKVFCREGIERAEILLPIPFRTFPADIAIVDQIELKIYEQESSKLNRVLQSVK